MTLKRKILIGYGVAFVLMGLVIGWSVANLVSLGKASDAILRENYRSILAAENMIDALNRQDSGILLVLLDNAEKGMPRFRESEAVFLQWLARAKDNITVRGEAELVQLIETDYNGYRLLFSKLIDWRDAGKTTFALRGLYQESVYTLFDKVYQGCLQLRKLNEETMYTASVTARQVAKRAIWSTAVVAVSALIVALVFSLVLSERIVHPLRRFMEASRKIASGDYSIQIPVETGDELGNLAGEFNRMSAQLERYHKMNIDQVISEKNKVEAILASIEDGVVVFDIDLKMTSINPAARQMLGLSFNESSTPYCSDIIPVPHICDLIRKTVKKGNQPAIPEEQRIVTFQEGEQTRHYLFSITMVRGKERGLSGIVLLLKDVTRLKEVEHLKNEFVMSASHELRTPLTSMGMSIDLLLEHIASSLSEKDRELLQAAHEEVHRLKALVSDLLDLSKIEAGRIELEFENLPVQTLFNHIQAVFKGQMENKNVNLTTELSKDLPMIRADANKIGWVLTNLISNALRYVSEGGHIKIQAKRVGPFVHLSVSDDGPGIPPEYQTKIFQKFVQVKGREAGGTGLGLAICKEIVRAHRGAIWVESSAGQGSTFTFTVPVAR